MVTLTKLQEELMEQTNESNTNSLAPVLLSFAKSAWFFTGAIILVVGVFFQSQLLKILSDVGSDLLATLPIIVIATVFVGWIRATGTEGLVARTFDGSEAVSIVLASFLGALSPFGSCQVIPLVAGLLAVGAPVPAVIAFWLASPLIDPPMLVITASSLGWEFAIAKAIAAIATGMVAGFGTTFLIRAEVLTVTERPIDSTEWWKVDTGEFAEKFDWNFWGDNDRLGIFVQTLWDQGWFFLRWMLFGFLVQAVILNFLPTDILPNIFMEGFSSTFLASIIGAPVYLHGVAAPPIIDGLITQGMALGPATAFLITGSATSLPAMIAIFSLVDRSVFVCYLFFGILSGVLTGLFFAANISVA